MNYPSRIIYFLIYIGFLGLPLNRAKPQSILLDNPISNGKVTLFQSLNDPNAYYYAPTAIRINKRENGTPHFRFLRIANHNNNAAKDSEIGLLHFMVELYASEENLQEALKLAKRINPQAKLKGPIAYDEGIVSIRSAFTGEKQNDAVIVAGTGKAPILEGSKSAISIRMNKEQTAFLWESFHDKSNSQISLLFQMRLSGYRTPKKAEISVNFDQLYQKQTINMAANSPQMAMDIKATLDEARADKSIIITNNGADENMEELIDRAYSKIISTMFDLDIPSDHHAIPGSNETDSSHSVSKDSNSIDKKQLHTAPTLYYRLKKNRLAGEGHISLNKHQSDKKIVIFTNNIGGVDCPSCFIRSNPDDPLLQVRNIQLLIEDIDGHDFRNHVNSISLNLRKKHGDGKTRHYTWTTTRRAFNKNGQTGHIRYQWHKDNNPKKWQEYEYQTIWSISGNHRIVSEWKKRREPLITLSPPFYKIPLEIEVDKEILRKHRIFSADIYINYYLEDVSLTAPTLKIKPQDRADIITTEILSKTPLPKYDVQVIWNIDNKTVEVEKKGLQTTTIYMDSYIR